MKRNLYLYLRNRSKDFVAFSDDLEVPFYVEVNSFGCHFKVTKLDDWLMCIKKQTKLA